METSDALLLPGEYWVRVEGRDADYELEARAVGAPDPNAEREPNDNDRQAHRLAVGVPRTGSLEDDADHLAADRRPHPLDRALEVADSFCE